MNITELNDKISKFSTELYDDIVEYVKENAKFKVGDVVQQTGRYDRVNDYYVICCVGFRENEIVYYGSKVVKSTGEISFMAMNSNVGTRETSLKKSTLKVKNKEISFFESHKGFDYNIKINVNIKKTK